MFRAFKVHGGGILAFVVLLVVTAVPALAAQAEKQIDCGVAVTNDAVVITRVTVGHMIVPCTWAPGPPNGRGRYQAPPPFQADDDWLQNVIIYLFNRTNKTIVHAAVLIDFPQTGDGSSPATATRSYNIGLGLRPAVANFSPRTGKPMPQDAPPLLFPGGQTLAIPLHDHADRMWDSVRDKLSAPITRIKIELAYFVFDDGMSWSQGGHFSVPDQEHPGKWRPMPDDYFPGNVHANWPPDRIGAGQK